MKRGELYVNGQPAKVAALAACGSSKPDEMVADLTENVTCVEEELDGFRYAVQRTPDLADDFPVDDAEYVVPHGAVFVLGDNRESSHDSRRFGPVPLDRVKGTVLFCGFRPKMARWTGVGSERTWIAVSELVTSGSTASEASEV